MAVQIGDRLVGPGYQTFIIAEIGINHNGSLDIVKKLIDVACVHGCDAVKFQKRTVDVVYTAEELAKPRENPFGKTNGDLKRGLEFGFEEYREIDRYCREKGIMWLASCWDEASVDFIDQFNPPCYKIASPSLTDKKLLEYTRSKGRPVILSTGMSTLEQIHSAVDTLGREDLVLLHCVSTYPSKEDEFNLSVIRTFSDEFPGVPVGFSCHAEGTSVASWAVAFGACLIEQHITLNRTMWGSDQSASLSPLGLGLMIDKVRRCELARGSSAKRVLESEVPIMKKLRRKSDF